MEKLRFRVCDSFRWQAIDEVGRYFSKVRAGVPHLPESAENSIAAIAAVATAAGGAVE